MHCHHRSVMKTKDEEALLQKLGLDFEVLDSGCCGMAGAFGFEKGDHYDVSIQCAERVLLPAVRQADQDTLVITNGFSCHEQILQQSQRQALHLAQVLAMAMKQGTATREKIIKESRDEIYKHAEKQPENMGAAFRDG